MRYYRFEESSPPRFPRDSPDNRFCLEEKGRSFWYLHFDSEEEAMRWGRAAGIPFLEPVELEECIDWGMQWGVEEGKSLQIDLAKLAHLEKKIGLLQLDPGPGFGDLSHPTTRLLVRAMATRVAGQEILDIGCGSGILSLSALLFGASFAYGVDIDPESVLHAERNAELNQLSDCCSFWKSGDRAPWREGEEKGGIAFLNMIRSEQEEVVRHSPWLSLWRGPLFTSGVLASERELYLQEAEERNWKVEEEWREGDWIAFHFSRS